MTTQSAVVAVGCIYLVRFMDLICVFLRRKNEDAPELLAAHTEYDYDANPDYIHDAHAQAESWSDVAVAKIVRVKMAKNFLTDVEALLETVAEVEGENGAEISEANATAHRPTSEDATTK